MHLPLMQIQSVENPDRISELNKGLDDFDILIFISRNAVKFSKALFPGLLARDRIKIFAVGVGTSEELRRAGFSQVLFNANGGASEGLLEESELQGTRIRQKNVLIVRGRGGRELLAKELKARGAYVEYAELYQRLRPEYDRGHVEKIFESEKPDAIIISSAEALKNLLELVRSEYKSPILNTALVVVSERIRDIALSLGFSAAIKVTMGYSDDDCIEALKEMFEVGNNEQ
ncbi:MAG: hypothetical protein GKR93_04210 [Gammaproteobacteria bacterium]|nr:hypothetical protein [Gammaproteobacteria bacterium]